MLQFRWVIFYRDIDNKAKNLWNSIKLNDIITTINFEILNLVYLACSCAYSINLHL